MNRSGASTRHKFMGWSYKRLWIMLIEKDLKRVDLKKMAGINAYTLARMGKNEPVHMEVIGKICKALDCKVEDIIEFVVDDADSISDGDKQNSVE